LEESLSPDVYPPSGTVYLKLESSYTSTHHACKGMGRTYVSGGTNGVQKYLSVIISQISFEVAVMKMSWWRITSRMDIGIPEFYLRAYNG